ncbi:MAG TPA: nucleotide kinase domain-containing protein, partial [Verrucomicrobiae bacterium]|nr:nucleotide kinase domain-containing protein [Verrucomicrobiae bacterium]
MEPHPGIYETYWYYAAERQRIFFARLNGEAPPYTDDLILQEYKFCNTYRACDRVSQFLIKDVIYSGTFKPEDMLFRILLFRLLNRIETWRDLEAEVGSISLATFTPGRYSEALEKLKGKGPIYGNAFILCANKAFGFDEKHKNHLALLEYIFRESDVAQKLLSAPSLEELFLELRKLPLLGNFMAYQMAIDLNYSELFDFSENDFTVPGPGAVRGIKKCFTSIGDHSPAEVIMWMV